MIHIVQINRDRSFLSPTLAAPVVERLASAFRSASRWRDRWNDKNFHAVARDISREHGGLVLLGPAMPFQLPPPFNEMFEPIEIGAARSSVDDQLNTIAGDWKTRPEPRVWLRWLLVILGILLLVVPLFFLPMSGIPVRGLAMVVMAFALCGLMVFAVFVFEPNRDRWFLIPGAIAVVPRSTRRNRAPRVSVYSPDNACLVIRHVKTGDSVLLMLELWTDSLDILSRAVTNREASGILAAWQSTHPPPADERLQELGRR